jgi:hypothetical protein
MVSMETVQRFAGSLPRSEERLVLDAWRMVVPKRVAAAYPG